MYRVHTYMKKGKVNCAKCKVTEWEQNQNLEIKIKI